MRQLTSLDVLARDHAEVLQDALEQILFRHERVEDQRGERIAIDIFQQGPAQRRLARADVSGDDDEAFAPADGVLEQLEGVRVRRAPVQKLRIRRQAERLLVESVVALVHMVTAAAQFSASTGRRARRVSS